MSLGVNRDDFNINLTEFISEISFGPISGNAILKEKQ